MYRTRVGYAGGAVADPTYRRIADHTECIQVDFDPAQISYAALLDEFFGMHDATRPAHSRQYASLALYDSEEQRIAAEQAVEHYSGLYRNPVLTEVRPLDRFYLAEDYHQKYGLRSNPALLAEMRGYYAEESALRESTAAMRLNGFAYAGGRASLLAREIDSYGLSEPGRIELASVAGAGRR